MKPFFELVQTVRLGSISSNLTPLRLFSVFVIVLLIGLVISRQRSTPGALAFSMLLITSGLSALLLIATDSSQLMRAAQAWLRLSGNFLVYWFFATSKLTKSDLSGIATKLLAAYTVTALINAAAILSGRAMTNQTSVDVERAAGVLHDAGGLSILGFSVLTLALTVWDDMRNHEKFRQLRMLLVGVVVLGGVLLTVSMTRSVILSSVVFIAIWSWRKGGGGWQRIILTLTLGVVGFMFALPVFMPRINQDIQIAQEGLTDEDIIRRAGSGRVGVWMDIVDALMERDWLETLIGSGSMLNAHNQWLALCWQSGFLGALFFTLGMLVLLTQLYQVRHWPVGAGAYAAIVALLVNSMFLASFNFTYSWPFMALGGGCVAVVERMKREQQYLLALQRMQRRVPRRAAVGQ
jgi:hypothetical protein